MYEDIEIVEVVNTLKCSHNWKLPGIYKLTDFSTHKQMTKLIISEMIKKPEKMRNLLTEGVT